jgi:hypothetical protein
MADALRTDEKQSIQQALLVIMHCLRAAFTAPKDRLMPPIPALPPKATEASHTRFDLAQRLASHCPTAFADAIALTGSAARGLAEPASDAEINCWAEALPSPSARADWLLEAGVTGLEAEPAPRSDGSEWFGGTLGGVPVEVGWQTFAALEGSLTPVREGLTTDPARLRLGELIVSAVVLRPERRLLDWQRALALYPDALRDALLADLTAQLTDRGHWATIDKLARRGEWLMVASAVPDMLRAAVRLLYVVNRRWEAGDKWLLTLAAEFPVMPPDWQARLEAILTALPEPSVALAQAWCDDALGLVRTAL